MGASRNVPTARHQVHAPRPTDARSLAKRYESAHLGQVVGADLAETADGHHGVVLHLVSALPVLALAVLVGDQPQFGQLAPSWRCREPQDRVSGDFPSPCGNKPRYEIREDGGSGEIRPPLTRL